MRRIYVSVTVLLLALSVPGTTSADPMLTWVDVDPSTRPPATVGWLAASAFDAARGEIVLYRTDQDGQNTQTWTWDGADWTRRSVPVHPPSTSSPSMAYDPSRGVVVFKSGIWNDGTWEWNGATWAQVSSYSSGVPSGPIVYHAGLGKVLASDCCFAGRFFEWDGAEWQENDDVDDSHASTCSIHTMVYDAARDRLLCPYPSAVYEWDGTNWSTIVPTTDPGVWAGGSGIAYHAGRQRSVMFGGSHVSDGTPSDELWEWDGTDWSLLIVAGAPGGRRGAVVEHDPVRDALVVFGGDTGDAEDPYTSATMLDDTWELRRITDDTAPNVDADAPALVSDALGLPLTGTASDDLSGVASVVVTYTDLLAMTDEVIEREADLVCDPATDCTWTAGGPGGVGVYEAVARAADVAGNVATSAVSLVVAVL